MSKRKLLAELLNRTVPVTITDLASLINKTGRTTRSYLDEIQDEFKKSDIEIVRKTNVGVYIDIDDKDRENLINTLEKNKANSFTIDNFSSKYRQVYILKTLLEAKFSYTIQMFAEELYCSKSTIVNELVYVQEWLKRYNLALQRRQNQGLWIEGDERDYRKALKELIDDIKDKEQQFEDLTETETKLDYRIDIVDYVKIKNMFSKINLYTIQRIIQQAEKKLGVYFTDQAFLNLITHMAITIERLKNHKAVSGNENYLESLKKEREYAIAEWVVNELSKEFKVNFPEEEIGYISIHMIGAKIQDHGEKCSEIIEKYDVNLTDAAKSIISLSSEILNIDLTKDEGLLTRLVLHLRPTIMRLKYGLRLTNPILYKIKEEYTNIFGVAWACNSIFERNFGVSINEDEVGYLVLHLALAVENIRSKIKTVIVCSSGIGTSQLVASKLVRKFDNLEITHILPYNRLNQKIIDEADLIVTTIKNICNSKKIVYVSTLVNENDYINIADAIEKRKKRQMDDIPLSDFEVNKESDVDECKEKIFEKELCFLDNDISDFFQAINYYGKLMEKMGYAKIGFHEDILNREKIGSTYIGKGIAIPHSKDVFVNKSRVCVVKFKNPVVWKENELDIIFILCLKFNDVNNTKKFFKKFYSIFEDNEMINKIKNAQSINDVNFLFD